MNQMQKKPTPCTGEKWVADGWESPGAQPRDKGNQPGGPARGRGRRKRADPLPHWLLRVCAGLLEGEEEAAEGVARAIRGAENWVGLDYAPGAQASRAALVQAVKANIRNQKDWPFELLQRHYLLPLSRRQFSREKQLFCQALARGLGLM